MYADFCVSTVDSSTIDCLKLGDNSKRREIRASFSHVWARNRVNNRIHLRVLTQIAHFSNSQNDSPQRSINKSSMIDNYFDQALIH